jgi:hypothetical protein
MPVAPARIDERRINGCFALCEQRQFEVCV